MPYQWDSIVPDYSSDTDSRTLMLGVKPDVSNSEASPSGQVPSRKRRRHNNSPNSAKLSSVPLAAVDSQDSARDEDYLHFDPTSASWTGLQPESLMDITNSKVLPLGHNRLQTGFKKLAVSPSNGGEFGSTLQSTEQSTQGSRQRPIELPSDPEDESDEEGGMLVNVEAAKPFTLNMDPSDDMDISDDAGPITIDDVDPRKPLQAIANSSKVTTEIAPGITQTTHRLRLADLSPAELDDQLKYCYFLLARDQIDLNRPAICLECVEEGHSALQCPQKYCETCQQDHYSRDCPSLQRCRRCRQRGHYGRTCSLPIDQSVPCDHCGQLTHNEEQCWLRFFPPARPAPTENNLKLWISCCKCASKSHLIGDCPRLKDSHSAGSWSLKSLDPDQITNLSLEFGIEGRVKQAMNRGVRPDGLRIKGRAANHQAGIHMSLDSSSEDDLQVRPNTRSNDKVKRTTKSIQLVANPSMKQDAPRYDRYNPPQHEISTPQQRGGWHATDSFGRRRSRSPDRGTGLTSTYRPQDRPGLGDKWRPGDRGDDSRRFDDHRNERPRSTLPPPPVSLPPRPPGTPSDYFKPHLIPQSIMAKQVDEQHPVQNTTMPLPKNLDQRPRGWNKLSLNASQNGSVTVKAKAVAKGANTEPIIPAVGEGVPGQPKIRPPTTDATIVARLADAMEMAADDPVHHEDTRENVDPSQPAQQTARETHGQRRKKERLQQGITRAQQRQLKISDRSTDSLNAEERYKSQLNSSVFTNASLSGGNSTAPTVTVSSPSGNELVQQVPQTVIATAQPQHRGNNTQPGLSKGQRKRENKRRRLEEESRLAQQAITSNDIPA